MTKKEELLEMIEKLRERYTDLHDTRGSVLEGFDNIGDFIASNF